MCDELSKDIVECEGCGRMFLSEVEGYKLRCFACGMADDDPDYDDYDDSYDDDGQPSEYEEWQDLYGGDVEEYGTFGDYPGGNEDW